MFPKNIQECLMDMDKFELIESVRELNPTASVEFLSQFQERELEEYLDHLMEADLSYASAVVAASLSD